MQDLTEVFQTRSALRMKWAATGDLQERRALRDGLNHADRVLAHVTMYHVPRSIRLQMLDVAHQLRDYSTASVARVVGAQFGVTPSRRTVRRWMADEVCRNELCPCRSGALSNEAAPENFLRSAS